MRIGFCGAHRTGKSTLAMILSCELEATAVMSGTSAIVAKHGFDMAVDNRIGHVGLPMQEEIQGVMIQAISDAGSHLVSDRTPIDVAAYLLADATAGRGDVHDWEEAMAQVDVAVIATNALFDAVIFVPPGIPFEARPDKPPMNNLYQEHHSFLVRGLHADLTMPTMCIERENTTIEGRMADIRRFLDMIGYQNMRDAA